MGFEVGGRGWRGFLTRGGFITRGCLTNGLFGRRIVAFCNFNFIFMSRGFEKGGGGGDDFADRRSEGGGVLQFPIVNDLRVVREKLGTVCKFPISNRLETSRWIDVLVDDQYDSCLAVLKGCGLYDPDDPREGDIPVSSADQVKKVLMAQLATDQVDFMREFCSVKVRLVPVMATRSYIDALNRSNRRFGDNPTVIGERARRVALAVDRRDVIMGDSIVGWKVAVTDGVDTHNLYGDDDNEEYSLSDRYFFNNNYFHQRGFSGVDLRNGILFMIESLLGGTPVCQLESDDITLIMSGEPPVYDREGVWAVGLYWVGKNDGFPGADMCPHLTDIGYHFLDDEAANFRPLLQFDLPIEEGLE